MTLATRTPLAENNTAASSGCGKSTLLRLLAGLDPDWQGTLLHDGVPIDRHAARASTPAPRRHLCRAARRLAA